MRGQPASLCLLLLLMLAGLLVPLVVLRAGAAEAADRSELALAVPF